ncbi:MAG: hypothetical protein HRU15_01285 [Planctomycetes bacterium]|nr:hypothetical protein [Planctomycetota bacterium]
MQVEIYRGSVDEVTRWCSSVEVLMRYNEYAVNELEHMADADLIAYVKKLRVVAEQVYRDGYDAALQQDPALLDSLLTDVLSIATYEGWDHPLVADGLRNIDELPSPGLLGYDVSIQGAQLYVIDSKELALARSRQAGDDAAQPRQP